VIVNVEIRQIAALIESKERTWTLRNGDIEIFKALTDRQLMGLCIEREAASEPQEGRIAVGTVILNRVDKKGWMGKTIQDVILKPWQFSWTMPEAGEAYYEQAVKFASDFHDALLGYEDLEDCFTLACDMIDGVISRDPDLEGCVQYLNPKTAAKTKEKWEAAGMKIIKQISHHDFFL
jgi:hypothetical protein